MHYSTVGEISFNQQANTTPCKSMHNQSSVDVPIPAMSSSGFQECLGLKMPGGNTGRAPNILFGTHQRLFEDFFDKMQCIPFGICVYVREHVGGPVLLPAPSWKGFPEILQI